MQDNLYSAPVHPEQFSIFIEKSRIFDKTRSSMQEYLKSWYKDDTDSFTECMRADLITVLEQYHFYNEFVSITKNFNFNPPIDMVSCTIRITDEEDDCCTRYRAIFDAQVNMIDDTMERQRNPPNTAKL